MMRVRGPSPWAAEPHASELIDKLRHETGRGADNESESN